ncbi:MAG: 4-hydroxy-tetrahydrodipicolinate reductase [Bdellovibrionales bacterium]|nr:4-hydroxy-tetrahydrodipicolinate reductase [Bdellovibrionales bacterium]
MSEKIKIGLTGASGRMGKSICELVKTEDKFHIQAYYDSKNPLDKWDSKTIDAVIDFSIPEVFMNTLKWCETNQKPLVSGTTGLNSTEEKKLKETSSKIPILWSPNMSLGIACFNEWLKKIPQTIKNWDIQISETHHRFKKDAPSGTALFLHQTLESQNIKSPTPHSTREGDVHGVHKVSFTGTDETLSIEHIAQDRKVFARGALDASVWILHQKPGFYQIKDCL